MRTFILMFFMLASVHMLIAQIPSNCNIPPILQNYYDKDVKHLALKRIYDLQAGARDSIAIPQSYQDTVWQALAAIFNLTDFPARDSVFDIFCIHQAISYYITHNIYVNITSSCSWLLQWKNLITITGVPALDSLLSKYGFTVTHYSTLMNVATLTTTQIINVKPVCDSIKTFSGVVYSEPSFSVGDGNEIIYTKPGTTRLFNFVVGFGDCYSGCMGSLTYQFEVESDCSVQYLGSTLIPAPGYPFPGFACCNITNNRQAGIVITANQNPFCPGSSVIFIANPNNGGSTPAYQWKVNGINAGTDSPTFIYNPANNDSVWCIMTSNLVCVSGSPAISNKIMMVIAPVPVVTFTHCFDSVTTLNAKPIKLKGGIPLGGTYSGPGVNSSTGIFTPSVAGVGIKTITYTYTNSALCSDAGNLMLDVRPVPSFTCGNKLSDIRDGKVYPTIQIGFQCWMGADLNYGQEISPSQHQRDNCIPEKYFNPGSIILYPASAYQWDELMRYDDTPGLQGFCPPGWHVPTEADWNILFANWTNNAFAGAPLKYSGYSGFNALLSGVRHQNIQWDYQNFATFFWSSTPYGAYKAWAHGMNDYDPGVAAYPSSRTNAFSIRCLRD